MQITRFASAGKLTMTMLLAGALTMAGCKKQTASTGSGSTGSAKPAEAPKPQSKTPKDVVLEFSRALSAGDAEKARSLSTGDAGEGMIDTLAKIASATANLQKELKGRFGEAATKLDIFTESPDPADELKRSTETINGDTAVIALSPTDKNASHLKKINGEWKFDVTKFKESAATAPQMRKIADAWNGLAQDVKAGKFATTDAFEKAFNERTGKAAGG